jgi:hypothetical protein
MLPIEPMRLGDLFDRTFRITGRTAARSALIILMLLVPACLLLVAGMSEFYATLGEDLESIASGQASTLEDIPSVLLGLLGLCLPAVFLADLAAELCVTTFTGAEMTGTPMAWQQALGRIAGIRLARAAGVVVLQVLAAGAVIVAPLFFLSLSGGDVGLMLVGTVILLSAFIALIFLIIRWAFALTIIACEDAGVTDSLRRSWSLVGRSWWRVFGILLLFNILASFAISLLTTPISLVGFWSFYKEYFAMLGSAASGRPDPKAMAELISSMGTGVGVSISLSMLLFAFIRPVYTTVLYFDLRARNQEFGQTTETPDVGDKPIEFIELT